MEGKELGAIPPGPGMLGETGREGRLRCLSPRLCGQRGALQGEPPRDPNPEHGWGGWGAPRGRVPVSHTKAQGGLGSTKPPMPPGPSGAAAPARPRQMSAPARPLPRSPTRLRPPRELLKCRLLLGRPYRPPGRARPLRHGRLALFAHSVPGRPRAPAAANNPATAPLPSRAPEQTTPTPL